MAAEEDRDGDGKMVAHREFIMSAVATALAHPLTYVKVLIQVGYDPLPPVRGKTFFGKDVMYLTGFLDYVKHIRSLDGLSGLYRGLAPRLMHNFVNSAVTNSVTSRIQSESELENEVDDDGEVVPVVKSHSKFLIETCQISIGKMAGCVISYPLHLISVRSMVQFVGRETHYSNLFLSIREVYQEEGILGFFRGLVPQLIGEMLSFWVFRTVSYFVETYFNIAEFSKSSGGKVYIHGLSQYVASFATFPFFLVTNMMAVNNTRLAAGNPPNMPIFKDWTDCWVHLAKERLLRRGDSIFRRTMAITSYSVAPTS